MSLWELEEGDRGENRVVRTNQQKNGQMGSAPAWAMAAIAARVSGADRLLIPSIARLSTITKPVKNRAVVATLVQTMLPAAYALAVVSPNQLPSCDAPAAFAHTDSCSRGVRGSVGLSVERRGLKYGVPVATARTLQVNRRSRSELRESFRWVTRWAEWVDTIEPWKVRGVRIRRCRVGLWPRWRF